MLIEPIILPYAVRLPMTDTVQGTRLCGAAAIFINIFLFVLGTKPALAYMGEVLSSAYRLGRGSPGACRALDLVPSRMVPDVNLVKLMWLGAHCSVSRIN